MELNINGDRVISNPDAQTIGRELAALGDDEFAVLRKDDLTFIQTLVDPDAGLVLEYQEGSLQEHFGTADPPRAIREVIDAFISYANGTDEWRNEFDWVPMELVQASFTVMVLVAPEAIDQIDHPLDCEERVELPDLGIDNLIALYALLVDATKESLEAEFSIIAEITPEGLDGVLLVEVPLGFQKTLTILATEAVGPLAAQWRATDYFPFDEYDETAAANAITALSAMATEALDSGKALIACALQ